jgi:2-polyprenyl-3-methyl-5-hydroxy-6-metoxy-1,4-benzoquinol methylase
VRAQQLVGQAVPLSAAVAEYWDEHIHDLAVATEPVGSSGFFQQLDAYRFEKLNYLPRLVNFNGYAGQELLEVGCGAGIDLARFAQGGAIVTGIDLSSVAIDLARQNLGQRGLAADLRVMDGQSMAFPGGRFDVVYAHGVLQYAADPERMIAEIHRVLKPEGLAILMVYNRLSWLNALSKVMKVELEHEDAPVLRKYSAAEFRRLLAIFARVQIVPERFPVKTQLHRGAKARLYNGLFVTAFNVLPKAIIRPTGWHLMAFANKNGT